MACFSVTLTPAPNDAVRVLIGEIEAETRGGDADADGTERRHD
jgi:hypothetical protein